MIGVVTVQAVVIAVLSMLCWKMYRDVLSMARDMAGVPDKPDGGNARIISPYKKKGGEES